MKVKQFLQNIDGVSNVAYSGKERRFYYNHQGKKVSMNYDAVLKVMTYPKHLQAKLIA